MPLSFNSTSLTSDNLCSLSDSTVSNLCPHISQVRLSSGISGGSEGQFSYDNKSLVNKGLKSCTGHFVSGENLNLITMSKRRIPHAR